MRPLLVPLATALSGFPNIALAAYSTPQPGYLILCGGFVAALVFFILHQRRGIQSLNEREAQLRESEASYRGLFNSVSEAIYILDGNGCFLDINLGAERMYGYRREELIGLTPADVAAPGRNDLERMREQLRLALAGTPRQFEFWGRRKNGEDFPKQVWLNRGRYFGRDVVIAMATDISERKRIDEELRVSRERLKYALQGANDGLWDWNLETNAVYYSPRWKSMLGYRPDELEDTLATWANLVEPESRDAALGQVHAYLDGKLDKYESEFRMRHKDGHWVEVLARACLAVDADGVVLQPRRLVGTHVDISARKQSETELRRSNAELEQFAYAISHDMRQPLRMIASYQQLLEKALRDKLDEETREYLHFATDGAKRLDQMLVALLEYSRVGRKTEPLGWIASREAVDEAMLFLKPAIDEAGARIEISGDWPRIHASRDELVRLFQNLIGNAVKYRQAERAPEIEVIGDDSNGDWRVRIRDNGIGIDPSQIPRLFQVFQRLQARARYEGAGIGLALCRKIVEHHGGHIHAESAGEGQGSTFVFDLPLSASPPLGYRRAETSSEEPAEKEPVPPNQPVFPLPGPPPGGEGDNLRSPRMKHLLAFLALALFGAFAHAADTYSFGVLSQRSAVLTAQYWNPILDYVGRKSGVNLLLKVARTAPESHDATERGEYDFIYSNHIFQPKMAVANYQVILRPRDEAITGQIVTLEDSPIRSLKELQGMEVGFPSLAAFVGYAVPMDQLLRLGIGVTPVFGGNQEGIMGQLKAGKVIAASVNSQVMRAFAARENMKYRVIWESVPFHNLPIAVHPRVPREVTNAVRMIIDGMEHDAEGRKVLEASAQVIAQKPPYGFQSSSPADYRSYTEFYRNTLVKDIK
ncbi:MAG: PAS domain S-box protein [Gallionellaceae bacterium]|nr:PAS domain S-box protein [Gallionellaceae bacterium]